MLSTLNMFNMQMLHQCPAGKVVKYQPKCVFLYFIVFHYMSLKADMLLKKNSPQISKAEQSMNNIFVM